MRKNDITSIEKTLSHLKLSSKEKEAVLSYKKIYDTGVCMETLPYLVLKFSKYLEKYSEIFGGNGTISAFFADEDLPKNIKNMNISGSQLENLGFSGAEIRKAQEKIFCDIISRKVENKKEELEKYAERIRKEI
jgi:Leucine-rich repeat (LRR) protein